MATRKRSTKSSAGNGAATSTPTILQRPDLHCTGEVGRTFADSGPAQFPQPVQPPSSAPNSLLAPLDNAGFGQFSIGKGFDIGMDVGSPIPCPAFSPAGSGRWQSNVAPEPWPCHR